MKLVVYSPNLGFIYFTSLKKHSVSNQIKSNEIKEGARYAEEKATKDANQGNFLRKNQCNAGSSESTLT